MRACLDGFVKRRQPVIPVLLPGCPQTPQLPLLLEQLTWVDCREGKEEYGFYQLIWGITGKKPDFLNPAHNDGPPVKPEPRPVIPVPYLHGWPADKIKAWQQETASALNQPVIFRDALRSGSLGPEMVLIPPGSFIMGSPASEPERNKDEGPQHFVTFSKAFAIGRYAVTFEEYDAFCLATLRSPVEDAGWGRGRRPVINVSWQNARDYCAWLSDQTGKTYRLPSEAAWEYACRAGTDTPFHGGDTINPKQANYDGNNEKTLPVGQFEPNAFGLHDMHGNVWEWVEDASHDSYAGAPNDGSVWEAAEAGAARVVRGGSWDSGARNCRCASRNDYQPDDQSDVVGFRCARVQA
jgi:formylglycine-generating enzyme required for sulfatase activity